MCKEGIQIVTCDIHDHGLWGVTFILETTQPDRQIRFRICWFPSPGVWPEPIPGIKGAWELLGWKAVCRWAARFFRHDEEPTLHPLMSQVIALCQREAPPPGTRWEGFCWHEDDPRQTGLWHLQAVMSVPLQVEFEPKELWETLQSFFGQFNGHHETCCE